MKRLLAAILPLAAGCTTQTEYGTCVGVQEEKDPDLKYRIHGWNLFWGVVFVETVAVPLIVLFTRLECPVGVRGPAGGP